MALTLIHKTGDSEVMWDSSSGEVYLLRSGLNFIGEADSSYEAKEVARCYFSLQSAKKIGKIGAYRVSWNIASKDVFVNDIAVGSANSRSEAKAEAKEYLSRISKGRVRIYHDKPIDLSEVELPDSFIRNVERILSGKDLPPVPVDTVLAIQELLERNKYKTEKPDVNDDSLKKKKTPEVHYSESFISQGLKVLREMAEKNISQMPYGEPFNFLVVIGKTDKPIIAVLDVPEELKAKIGDKAYIVRE